MGFHDIRHDAPHGVIFAFLFGCSAPLFQRQYIRRIRIYLIQRVDSGVLSDVSQRVIPSNENIKFLYRRLRGSYIAANEHTALLQHIAVNAHKRDRYIAFCFLVNRVYVEERILAAEVGKIGIPAEEVITGLFHVCRSYRTTATGYRLAF